MGGMGTWGEEQENDTNIRASPVKGRSLVRIWLNQSAEVRRRVPSFLSVKHSLIKNPTRCRGEGERGLCVGVVCLRGGGGGGGAYICTCY